MTTGTMGQRIFHPTDLGAGSTTAFLHALRLAIATRSTLTIMHVARNGESHWSDLPGVRDTLAHWGLLRDAGDTDGLKALGVGVRKVIAEGDDPVRACLDHLGRHPTDLVVLATHRDGGRRGWMKRKVAEPLARGAGEPTLLVPEDSRGFVDPGTGQVALRRVLVPVAMHPAPRRALDAAMAIAGRLNGGAEVAFTLLHVGTPSTEPSVEAPAGEGWTCERITREGDVVGTIAHMAQAMRCDLVVMATKGHDGFLDALRGSTTEQVLRAVHCPVLAVPA